MAILLWNNFLAVYKVAQLLEALAIAITADKCRKGTKRLVGVDADGKSGGIYDFCFWQLQLLCYGLFILPLSNGII